MRECLIGTAEPVDIALTLAPMRRGRWDPTSLFDDAVVWRAMRTPEGPTTMCATATSSAIRVRSWGPGASWVIRNAPELTGATDDPSVFVARHTVVRDMQRRLPGLRIARTNLPTEALVASIVEQKVNGVEAGRSYAALVRLAGEVAPGPVDLLLPPDPRTLAQMPYYAFHPLGIERKRAETIR
ncbi:MAG: DNA-3-methyladenine glycosylase 2 family protein, partial [Actinomycetota bacterium]